MKYFILCVLISVALSGCGSPYRQGESIPFTEAVIYNGESILDYETYYPDSYHNPALFVLDPVERSQIQHYLPPTQQAALQQADLKQSLLIALFQGVIGYANAGVQIEDVLLDDHRLYIQTHFIDPEREERKGKLLAPGGSFSAFEVIAIDRTLVEAHGPTLEVYIIDDETQTIVLSTKYNLER